MKKVHYFAAWTHNECFCGCDHEHQTVTSATACINEVGGYVVAVETHMRELTEAEEAEFQFAKYGIRPDSQTEKAPTRPLSWLLANGE
jgi:hypothetical protein